MPTYTVKLQDGAEYQIEAPNDAALKDAVAKLQAPRSRAISAGQMARAALTGLGGLPALVADAPGFVVNTIARKQVVEPMLASRMFQQGLDAMGLPAYGGSLPENLASALTGAAAPIGLGTQLVRNAPQLAPSVLRGVGEQLARGPVAQTVGSQTGTLAAQTAAAMGAGPVGQTIASVAGGAAVPGSGNVVGRSRAAIDPLTESGRERAVGEALRRMANDPIRAQQNLATAKPIVPGSRPTTAQAAGDYGIAAADGPVFETSGMAGLKGQRLAEQNSARNAFLDKYGINEDVVSLLDGKAEKIAGPIREQAFAEAKRPTLGPVREAMSRIIQSETYVRPEVKQAIKFAGEQLAEAAGEGGKRLDVRRLYEARKSISQAIAGRYDSDKGSMRLAAKELLAIRDAIDESLNQATGGGYGKYMERYSRVAQVKEGVENAAAIRTKATTASPEITAQDPTAQYGRFLSQPAMARALGAAVRDSGVKLLPRQQRALELVLKDLDRAASVNNAAVRPQGSSTARNITMSYVLGKVLTDSLSDNATVRAVAKPLQAIYGLAGTEQELQQLLAKAMLEPEIAAQLLAKANIANAERLANSLAAVAQRGAVGGTAGTLATQQ